jgi:pectinesterase
VNASQYLDVTAASGVTYHYRVTAVDGWQGESSNSASSARPGRATTSRPAPPTNLAAAGVGNGVSLTWSANNDADLAGYRVLRRPRPTALRRAERGAHRDRTAFHRRDGDPGGVGRTDPGRRLQRERVAASKRGATATAGDQAAPAAPPAVAASVGRHGVRVTWSAPADPDVAGYRVYRSAAADGTFAVVSGTAL